MGRATSRSSGRMYDWRVARVSVRWGRHETSGQYNPSSMAFTRREFLMSAASAPLALTARGQAGPDLMYGATTIPLGIRSRLIANINGIAMHALEAGYETPNR